MTKMQSYTITFNTAQPSTEAAMYNIGSAVNSAIREHVQYEIVIGNVSDNSIELSEDGLTLTVSRSWTDGAYEQLMAIASENEIQTLINDLPIVSSVTYGFSET